MVRPSLAFCLVVAGLSSVLSATWGTELVFEGASLSAYGKLLTAWVLIALLSTMGPLVLLTPQLLRARRRGRRDFGKLATSYTRQFENKWIHSTPEARLLGTSDLQSLADLGGSRRRRRSSWRSCTTSPPSRLALRWKPRIPSPRRALPLERWPNDVRWRPRREGIVRRSSDRNRKRRRRPFRRSRPSCAERRMGYGVSWTRRPRAPSTSGSAIPCARTPPGPVVGCSIDQAFVPQECFYPGSKHQRSRVYLEALYLD